MESVRYTPPWAKAIGAFILLAIALGALALLYIIFGEMPAANRATLYLEAAKALFQLVGVLLLGAVVAAVIKYFDNSKKADKALHDYRIEFLGRLTSLDESVKKSRHVLRSAGLTNQFGQPNPVITQEQAGTYFQQLPSLQEVQSGIDRLIQDIGSFRGVFSGNAVLEGKLKIMQSFLRDLVQEYEESRPKFPQVGFDKLPKLLGFTGISTAGTFNDWVRAYDAAVIVVRTDLLPLKAAIEPL